MLRRRQIATEDDRIGALLDQRRQRIDQSGQLGIGFADEFLGALHQSKKRRIGIEGRTRLDIDGVLVVAVLVIDLRFEAVALVGHPVPQGAQGRGR